MLLQRAFERPVQAENVTRPQIHPQNGCKQAMQNVGTTHANPRQNPIKRQFWRGFVMGDQIVSQQNVQPFKTLFNRIVIPFQTTILVGAPIWSFLCLDRHLDRHLNRQPADDK